jgi:hypothetical protein
MPTKQRGDVILKGNGLLKGGDDGLKEFQMIQRRTRITQIIWKRKSRR